MALPAYKVTSTTTLTAVSNCVVTPQTNHLSVMNLTDGDIELYVGDTVNPQIICPKATLLAFDNKSTNGQAYVRNSTGTGGAVYLHFWYNAT